MLMFIMSRHMAVGKPWTRVGYFTMRLEKAAKRIVTSVNSLGPGPGLGLLVRLPEQLIMLCSSFGLLFSVNSLGPGLGLGLLVKLREQLIMLHSSFGLLISININIYRVPRAKS